MTMQKILKLYEHYKRNYDFTLTQRTYKELEEKYNHSGEMFD